jgi:hypothetical protein
LSTEEKQMQEIETAVKELIARDYPVARTLTANPRLLNDLVSGMKSSGVKVMQIFLDPRSYVDVLQGNIQYQKNEHRETLDRGLMGFLTGAAIHMSRHIPFRDAWVIGMRIKTDFDAPRLVVEHYKIDRP